MDLHQRIAEALGWSLEDVQSFSLPALRELVRPVSPKLADHITETIHLGMHVVRGSVPGVKDPKKI